MRIFLQQTVRKKSRFALNIVLLCAVTVFFVVSLNLYHNSRTNLQAVENAYTTIATMEIYGDVNKAGELVHPGDESYVGRHWLSVEDFDLSPLLALDSVERIDLRTRVGAYIPGQIAILQDNTVPPAYPVESVTPFSTNNIIRFMLDAEEPMEISLLKETWQWLPFPIRVLDTSNQNLQYPETFTLRLTTAVMEEAKKCSEDIRRLNRSEVTDRIILYPDVEYVMSVTGGSYWQRDEKTGVYTWIGDYAGSGSGVQLDIYPFDYYTDDFLYYSKSGIHNSNGSNSSTLLQKMPFALQRYEDVKDDPVWKECSQGIEYSAHSFIATLTDDISLISAWYQGAMYLHEGRMITKAEYDSGAKVCMVSAQMAEYQGWQVGDTLDMHLYIYDAFYDKTSVIHNATMQQNYMSSPVFLNECGGFFEEDTYEIVGIFGIREFTEFGETAKEVFYNPWNGIYIPANAAPNAPAGPIQPSLITVELKNGTINQFKETVEKMGLTDQKNGEYELKFSYFEQDYSKIQPGLAEMNRNAKILLGLSAALLAVTMILTAFLFSRQHKHSAGILRMLGGSKGQAFIAIFTCAAVVVAAGGVVGTVLGGVLTQSVGTSILGDTEAAVALATGASPLLTALTGAGCIALFLLLTAIFTATYIGKEPRELLPQDKG
jgi:hypothetical protein